MKPGLERADVVARRPPGQNLTYQEFLDWCDEDTYAEWVAGEVIMTSPASLQHQLLGSFLERLLVEFVERRDLGQVLRAPFQMKLADSGREPDVLFIATEHLDRLRETYLDGPADLVVEIISPESGVRDRGEKFYEYEAGGVSEYWLVDPLRQQVEFYRPGADGLFRHVPVDATGVYQSQAIPGFWLKVHWLWEKPLHSVSEALSQLLAG